MTQYKVPLVIRGRVIEDYDAHFGGRDGATELVTPSVGKYMSELALTRPSAMSDLYAISFEEILDFLEELGTRLHLSVNSYVQDALDLSLRTSGLSEGILRDCYANLHKLFAKEQWRQTVDRTIGIDHVEGWVEHAIGNGGRAAIRAFGARSVHVIAGNVPQVAAITIARNAVTRGDAIIKTPSNDPLTASAIARTMIDMASDHPLTRHLSVAYWKGGTETVEERLYRPANIEKIIAWGGFASITHISKYLQPGIDLITLDPKLSSTILGRETFVDEATMRAAAALAALDVGVYNQEACSNARVIYVESGTDQAGLDKANAFGEMLNEEIRALPPHFSGPAVRMEPALEAEMSALRLGSAWHKIYGGGREGAVVVSQMDEPVDFAKLLANRVANVVPVDDLEIPVRAVTAYTQTIGIYPEALKAQLRDRLSIHGAQRIVSLGGSGSPVFTGPQDAIEPMRRMCKWIIDESRPESYLKQALIREDEGELA